MTMLGAITFCASVMSLGLLLVAVVIFKIQVSFMTVLILSLVLVTGGLWTCLGVVGEYVGRIYHEVLQRPNYLIKRVVDGESEDPMPLREAK
jgi:hypothetical protein